VSGEYKYSTASKESPLSFHHQPTTSDDVLKVPYDLPFRPHDLPGTGHAHAARRLRASRAHSQRKHGLGRRSVLRRHLVSLATSPIKDDRSYVRLPGTPPTLPPKSPTPRERSIWSSTDSSISVIRLPLYLVPPSQICYLDHTLATGFNILDGSVNVQAPNMPTGKYAIVCKFPSNIFLLHMLTPSLVFGDSGNNSQDFIITQ